jgi:hypothetical protein
MLARNVIGSQQNPSKKQQASVLQKKEPMKNKRVAKSVSKY